MAEALLGSGEKQRASAERHPLKRIGSPQEVAHFAAQLLSDNGSWITGQVMHVDGGMGTLRVFK